MPELPTHVATRYVQPLREGGSLPAVVDTDGGGLWVVKFRGAGQGAKVLIAELVVGMLAIAAGLPAPALALVHVTERFGRTEPDSEIQELLKKSHGINVGLRYLDGAFNFDVAAAGHLVGPELAARIVWLDAFVTNPDRTHRNPNLMIWTRRPWLIDHGAALYAHHDWAGVDEARTRTPFPLIRSHVLLAASGDLRAADEQMAARLTDDVIGDVLRAVPDVLLLDPATRGEFDSADAVRERYRAYLTGRLASRHTFVDEAVAARERAINEPPQHLRARR